MKTLKTSRLACIPKAGVLLLALLAAKTATQAADISWTGGTDSFTNAAAWSGGVVPGPADNAINDNGLGNVVQVNAGNPDWYLNRVIAGFATGDGAFVQNGQAVNVNSSPKGFRLGVSAGLTGSYTLNGGSINFSNSGFNVGELGTAVFNMNGGTLTGATNITINLGVGVIPNAVTATVDAGPAKTGFTWSEAGFSVSNPTLGLPAASSPVTSVAQPDHAYVLPPTYVGNNAVMVDSNTLTSATMTVSSPSAYTALSFLGSAGNGPETLNYKVNHADSTFETGTIVVPDWFATNAAVITTGARATADGVTVQLTGAFPKLIAMDIALTNTTSAVTSVNLSYAAGVGEACLFALSGSTGSGFSAIDITGFNEDAVMEAAAVNIVSGSVTDIFNQTNGTITLTGVGQFLVGNYGNGVYNFSGGTNNVNNYVAIGRSGGSGIVNMTGGQWNQTGGGNNFLVGTGYQSPGGNATGVLNQNGGLITCQGQFLCPENSPSTGTYNVTNGALVVNNWIAIGRNGGSGVMNIAGGSVTKTGGTGSHIVIGAGGIGIVNQSGGAITNLTSDTWIGENSAGTWNLNGGVDNFAVVHVAQASGGSGNLKLNGGTLIAQEVTTGNPAAGSQLLFNGGTLTASATSVNFLHDLTFVGFQGGGGTIDSAGFNITIPQLLEDAGGGGLTKVSAGTLILTAPNTYTGPTVVNGGKVLLTTDATGNGDLSVANGAGFGVTTKSLNAQYTIANASFAGPASSLDLDLGSFGNPSVALLNIGSTLTVSGVVTVNVADSVPAVGQIPLVKYSALAGGGSFALGTLPSGSVGYLSNNVLNASIDLVITSAGAPRWDGTVAGGVWDINTTANWFDLGTSLTSTYHDGTAVLFNDAAAGTTNVNLITTVTPATLTFSDNSLGYVLTGVGKISGSLGLTKSGAAPVAILNTGGNNFTGPVVISDGALIVTNLANGGSPSAIGASAASPTNLVLLNNGTLSYQGAPVTINRGYSFQGTNATLDVQGDLTLSGAAQANNTVGIRHFNKTGTGQLAFIGTRTNELSQGAFANTPGFHVVQGSVLFDGSAGFQTNHTTSDLWVGGGTNFGASLVVSNTTLNIDNYLAAGRGNGNLANTSSIAVYNSLINMNGLSLGYNAGLPFNYSYQFLTLSGNTVLTNRNQNMNIGESVGSVASVLIKDTAVLGSTIRCALTSTSTVTVANSGKFLVNSYMSIGNGSGSIGTVILKDNAFMNVQSDLNMGDNGPCTGNLSLSNSAIASGNVVYVGKSSGTVGNLTLSSGTFLGSRAGPNGGSFIVGPNSGDVGNVTMSGGTINCNGEFWMGAVGQGNWTQTAGNVFVTNWIAIGRSGGSVGTFNISGGSITEMIPGSKFIIGSGGAGTINISGTASVNSGGQFLLGENGGSTGTVNLNGGNLTVPQIARQNGTANFNFNGGTITVASNANVVFMTGLTTASVKSGGLTVDTGTNIINIGQPLLDGTGGGGLTKVGNGILRLNGASTYTGTTFANVGGIGGTGTITSPLVVASGATLTPGVSGVGTFTVNNAVTLSAGSSTYMEINKTASTKDLLQGASLLTYGGILTVTNISATAFAAGDSFKLFDATNYAGAFSAINPATPGAGLTWNTSQLTVNGTISIINSTTTPLLTTTVSGGNLNVVWPSDHLGYTLQIQTNSLSVGLGTNWSAVPGSTTTNAVAIPLNPANPAVFLRLVP